ncbi:MAG: glycosyltransferase, partial [Anaerolineaceae bacterium]|nr:glycosyltransferase [Anaerolineaceae bacterium]
PNPAVPQHEMAQVARELTEEIGETGKSILFFDWLSIQDREALLSEVDVGVVCHPDSLETRFALRTRVLDYFWAGIPVISTDGDVLSEVIKKERVGWVVPAGDVDALAETLMLSLSTPKNVFQERYQSVQKQFNWEKQLIPLKIFCLEGGYAADRLERKAPEQLGMSTRLTRKIHWLKRRFMRREPR